MISKSILGLAALGLFAFAPLAQAQSVQTRDPQVSTQSLPSDARPILIGGAALVIFGIALSSGGGGGSSNNTTN